ncbi:MAG TPA: nucleotidyl transferase AbiEii/AbiGii toxin family protein [Opitutaceae bacterium]|jgi:hypothetical protein|nr:nucleotidyl transferase AbiEii/AbiGii toxin family protein [Opitutaceae bacterium]
MNLDSIVDAAKAVPLPLRGHAAKEALQRYLMTQLQNDGLLVDVAFIGGTALRFLHQLPRYSEDLDFISKNPANEAALDKWSKTLNRALAKLGAVAHVQAKRAEKEDAKVRKRFFVVSLLAEAPAFRAFAPRGLQVSFEIDLDPPGRTQGEAKTLAIAGNQVTVPTLNLPSLMAGKLHILLTRKDREKGRDWFDYAWYRRASIVPNVPQLQSAIAQTSDGPEARFWMSYLRERTKTVNWQQVRDDVKPFLEDPAAADSLNEVAISRLTPYPDFPALMAELQEQKLKHPILAADHPVRADIESAALEGIEEAIDCRSLIADLEKEV